MVKDWREFGAIADRYANDSGALERDTLKVQEWWSAYKRTLTRRVEGAIEALMPKPTVVVEPLLPPNDHDEACGCAGRPSCKAVFRESDQRLSKLVKS